MLPSIKRAEHRDEGRLTIPRAAKNSRSEDSTARFALPAKAAPTGVTASERARASVGCGRRSTNPLDSRVRITCDVIIASVRAYSARPR
ncbi:hypothetical protein ACETU7_16520 [Rhodococcus sp. 3Y1]